MTGSAPWLIVSARLVVACVLALVVGGCGEGERAEETREPTQAADSPLRLEAPLRSRGKACAPGEYELRDASGRRALMMVTPPASAGPRALLVALRCGERWRPAGSMPFEVRGAFRDSSSLRRPRWDAWTLAATDVRFVGRSCGGRLHGARWIGAGS